MILLFTDNNTILYFKKENVHVLIEFARYLREKYPYNIRPTVVKTSIVSGESCIICKCTVKSRFRQKLLDSMFEEFIKK